MSETTAAKIRRKLAADVDKHVEHIEWFARLGSTSSYLLAAPRPSAGTCRIAIASEQTEGRGRGENHWQSAPGAGLWMSVAYTFPSIPENVAALTLAIGAGVAHSLQTIGVADIRLKWPNDLVVGGRKLGGILLDSAPNASGGTTVICGLGINTQFPDVRLVDQLIDTGGSLLPVGLDTVTTGAPAIDDLAAMMIERLIAVLQRYETDGFSFFAEFWRRLDWLRGKTVTVRGPQSVDGVADGITDAGALILIDGESRREVVSGTVRIAQDPATRT